MSGLLDHCQRLFFERLIIESYLEEQNLTHTTVFFEDLVANPNQILSEAFQVPCITSSDNNVFLKRQSNAINKHWKNQFRTDLAQLDVGKLLVLGSSKPPTLQPEPFLMRLKRKIRSISAWR